MTDAEMLAWLLDRVTRTELDQHGQPACFACFPGPWHSTVRGGTFHSDTPHCNCPCHEIRGRLGIEDPLAPEAT